MVGYVVVGVVNKLVIVLVVVAVVVVLAVVVVVVVARRGRRSEPRRGRLGGWCCSVEVGVDRLGVVALQRGR